MSLNSDLTTEFIVKVCWLLHKSQLMSSIVKVVVVTGVVW